jgi:hypothetical protein
MTNFLDIIHRLSLIKDTRLFEGWSVYVVLFCILHDLTTSLVRRYGLALSIGPNRIGVIFT